MSITCGIQGSINISGACKTSKETASMKQRQQQTNMKEDVGERARNAQEGRKGRETKGTEGKKGKGRERAGKRKQRMRSGQEGHRTGRLGTGTLQCRPRAFHCVNITF